MIYVPVDNPACVVVRDSSTLRVYDEIPRHNSTIDYTDYYYTSNYLYQEGSQNFSQYTTIPTCLDNSIITNEWFYRNDLSDILLSYIILAFLTIYLPIKIVTQIVKKGGI